MSGDSRDGPRPSFEDVYRRWAAYVFATLRRLGVPARHCEDALQDVFLVVLRRLPEYRPRNRMNGWLVAIAFHVAAKYRHRERREPVMDNDESPDLGASPEQGTAERELALRLLDGIEPERRVVFILRYLDELTLPEIAHALGIPEGTVSTRLRLARQDFDAAVRRHRAREGARGFVPVLGTLQLLDAERTVPPLPEGVEERVWARLQRAPGFPGGGEGAAGDGQGEPGTRSLAGTARGLAGGGLFGVGVLCGVLWAPLRAPPTVPDAAPAVATATAEAPSPHHPSAPSATPSATVTAGPTPSGPASSPPSPRRAPRRAPDLAAERALVTKAADALGAGVLDEAVSALEEHARRFPGGGLAEEREATWIAVLLRAGRSAEARERIEDFVRAHPQSARVGELRAAAASESP